MAQVPWTITGNVTRAGRFVVFTAGQDRGQTQRLVVDVAPGQTHGTIPVEYRADREFGYDQQTQIALWPLRAIATDDYLGSLTVVDDDPKPTIDVDVPRTVREGRPIELEVTVQGRTSVQFYAYGQAVRGPGTNLQGSDVPLGWLQEHGDASRPGRPLWRSYLYVQGDIPLVIDCPVV